jgi:hypothetical protein
MLVGSTSGIAIHRFICLVQSTDMLLRREKTCPESLWRTFDILKQRRRRASVTTASRDRPLSRFPSTCTLIR